MSIEKSIEFQTALNEACEKQYREYLYGEGGVSSDKIGDTMVEIQKQRREIEEKFTEAKVHADQRREEMRIMSDPHLREITEAMRARNRVSGGLVCPRCGDIDHGNKMNKKPWCIKCNLPLMSAEKAEKWLKPQPPKKFSRGFNDPEDVMRCRK